jgi:hypothetical protein
VSTNVRRDSGAIQTVSAEDCLHADIENFSWRFSIGAVIAGDFE